jgi:hypothetical protein
MLSVEIWLRLFLSDGFPFMWPTHAHGYWVQRNEPNALVLTFEDMNKDKPGTVRTIADFMGVELSANEFANVCEKSSLPYMKRNGRCFNPPAMTPLVSTKRQMIRRGESGKSDESLSSEQPTTVDAWCREVLSEIDSHLPFDELWGRPLAENRQPECAGSRRSAQFNSTSLYSHNLMLLDTRANVRLPSCATAAMGCGVCSQLQTVRRDA